MPASSVALLETQRDLLERIASGEALAEVLAHLCLRIEGQFPRAVCTVLLVDEAGSRLLVAAAPSLGDEFSTAVDGLPIGPNVAACGAAAYGKHEVVAEDVRTDPLWSAYRQLAALHQLKACASVPIVGPDEVVLGTFALYHHDAGPFEQGELALLRQLTGLAALAIRSDRREKALLRREVLSHVQLELSSHPTSKGQRSAESFRALFDSSPVPMVLTRVRDGSIFVANSAAEALFRLKVADAPEKAALAFYANPEDRDRLVAILREHGSVRDFDLDMLVQGTIRRIVISANVLIFEGEPAMLAGFSDITDRVRTEDALRSAQKLESLGILAGGIAHDFNNLLTAILGNLNLLQLQTPVDAGTQLYLQNIETAVVRAAELTKQMLAYSGKGRFVVKVLDLNDAVREMTQLLSVSISKRVRLRYQLTSGLPKLQADAAQIQQVIMNLVTNASDAIGDREGVIAISTGLEHLDSKTIGGVFAGQPLTPGPFLTLDVTDSGCGMSSDVMKRIFDPFFTTKSAGRGLGLSAMHGILRGHGAGIKIQSEQNRGSTFKLFFPVSDHQGEPTIDRQPEPKGSVQRTIALVVDDEAQVRRAAVAMVEMLGFAQVISAADGQEAVEQFQERPDQIGFVLMDLTMPRLNGKDAFRRMREMRTDVRVVLTSGYNEQEAVQEFIGKGLAGFIQKPYSLTQLRTLVDDVMAMPLNAPTAASEGDG